MKPLTLARAKKLQHGEILHHKYVKNADGSPVCWRVNGKVKTWKRDPGRIRVPLKHGLWNFGYLTEQNFNLFFIKE